VTFAHPSVRSSRFPATFPHFKIHFIDVAYGDAFILQTPESGNILIDGGKQAYSPRLLAALQKLNIQSIDMLIITHFHKDHVGGLFPILENFMQKIPGEIRIPFEIEDSEIKAEIAPIITQLKKHRLHVVRQGEKLLKTATLQIEVLHPENLTGNQNEDSLVLLITHGMVCFLLMADIGLETQKKLYNDYGEQLKCDLMKIPHHANDTAVFEPFLKCASPQISVLTIGENDYQAPNAKVLSAYRQQSKTLYRTDQDGNITASSDGRTLQIECGWT